MMPRCASASRSLGLEIEPPQNRTPQYLAKFLPEEVARWTKVVHDAGITPR